MRFSPEDIVQSQICGLLDAFAIPGLIWFAVPNGGHRAKSVAALLRQTGVKAGVADMVIIHPEFGVHFLEVKTMARGSRLSKAQEAFKEACGAIGVPFAVARSKDEARDILLQWGSIEGDEEE